MLKIRKMATNGTVYHFRCLVSFDGVGNYVDCIHSTAPWRESVTEVSGLLHQGESWGIENEVTHHEFYGDIKLYPIDISSDPLKIKVYENPKWPKSGANVLYGCFVSSGQLLLQNGVPFRYQRVSASGHFFEHYGVLNSAIVSLKSPRNWTYHVEGIVHNIEYDKKWNKIKEWDLEIDTTRTETRPYLYTVKLTDSYPNVITSYLDAFNSIETETDNFGNTDVEKLQWECWKKIADECRVANCNLLAYGKDMAHSTELLTPFIDLITKGINAKTVASCFLDWFYGLRLTTYDTEEILTSSANISLAVTKDQPSRDAYQTAVLAGYKGSYDEYVGEFEALGNFYSEGKFSTGFEFLASALLSSVTRHATRTMTSKHARSPVANHTINSMINQSSQVCVKAYLSPYSSQTADRAILNSLQAFDACLSLENIVDFIPLSFIVNWFLTTGDSLENLEASDFLQTLPVAGIVQSLKRTLTFSIPYVGTYSYEFYNRTIQDKVPSPPIGISFKGDLSFLSHWQEGTALFITLRK